MEDMDDEPIDKELAAGDPAEWDPTKLLEHAERMTRLKDKIYEKAKVNINEAQKKSSIMTTNIQIQRYCMFLSLYWILLLMMYPVYYDHAFLSLPTVFSLK